MQRLISRWLAGTWPSGPAIEQPPCVPSATRVYAVGDVHGCIDLLDPLFERIDQDLAASPIENPIQVFLGDYIDRGPGSREVLQRLIERGRTQQIICLKGNHETFLLDFLRNPMVLESWLQWGGMSTLISYGLTPPRRTDAEVGEDLAAELRQAMPKEHRNFIENLPLTFVCGDYLFVHAGIRPGIQLADQKEQDLLWIREEFLISNNDFGKIVVHGHTPVSTVDTRKNRINIDTGAYASGNLTCLVIEGETRRFI
jgi:serine/threonine protein phosphatase 1